MAEGKNQFLLFKDILQKTDYLSDEEMGQLFRHILRYVNDMNPEVPSRIIEGAFRPIQINLKESLVKWEKTCNERSKSGKLGGEAKARNRAERENATKSYQTLPNAKKSYQKLPNLPDTDTDTDNSLSKISNDISDSTFISDNSKLVLFDKKDLDTITPDLKKLRQKKMSDVKIEEVPKDEVDYFRIAEAFRNLFIKNLKESHSPTTHQDNAKYGDYVKEIRLMATTDKVTRDQFMKAFKFLDGKSESAIFWHKNILSITKLRKNMAKLLMSSAKDNSKAKKEISPALQRVIDRNEKALREENERIAREKQESETLNFGNHE